MTSSSRTLTVFATVWMTVVCLPAVGVASPWTVNKDKFVLSLQSTYQTADDEYLPDGHLQQFPLDGQFTSTTFKIGGRYGFTSRFEGAFELNLKQVNYESHPAILEPPDNADDRPTLNAAIRDFSEVRTGAGDIFLHGRYNLVRSLLMVTSETTLKTPTGYQQPNGTFKGDNPANPLADDVTLGAGQSDLTQSILLGLFVPPTRSFIRLDAGYNHRFGSPGDQAVGNFSIGQYVGKKLVVFAGANGAYTLFDGQSIGQSFITRVPGKKAGQLSRSDIEQIPIRLDKSYLNVNGGVIIQFPELEVRASYGQIVVGNNIPRIRSLSLSAVYSLNHLTGSKDTLNNN